MILISNIHIFAHIDKEHRILFFFNIFPQGSSSNCAIWNCSTRLILVNFWFLKSTENFLQHSDNLNFVAICGGFNPFWPQIDWTITPVYLMNIVFWKCLCFLFFSCDQAALQMVFSVCPSVCLSVRPSVRHTFLTMFPSSYHHEIFRSYYQWQKWRPCKRSRSEVKGQGHRGHNPTLSFPDCNSSLNSRMMMKWCI